MICYILFSFSSCNLIAAYSAYVHGYQHKFHYFLRILNNIEEELRPLDELITSKLIPSIVGSQLSEVW